MTPRLPKTIAATLAITALLTAPLSAYAISGGEGEGITPSARRAEPGPGATDWVALVAPGGRRGQVVSATVVARLSTTEVDAAAAANGFVGAPKAKYAVTLYRVIYRTIDHRGRPTTASGLVVVPGGKRGALTAVEYLHGTNATKTEAATVDPQSPDRAVVAMFAGAGLAGIAPDYLGLGLGPGRPPYLDLRTETTSSADLLLAANTLVDLKRDVLVTGFSQGGRTSLALGRALQRGEVGRFRLGALAPVAGPYDLLGTELPAVFRGDVPPQTSVAYLAYLVTAWKHTIGLYDDPAEAFRPQYAKTIEALFDGTHSYEEIGRGIPDSPDKLFTPAFLAKLKHPTGAFRQALREGDRICTDWTPKIPVTLYYGNRDQDVVPANATSCATNLNRRGAKVTARSLGAVDHNGTARAAYPELVRLFSQRG